MLKGRVSTIEEEFEKAQVKGFVRTRKGKMERVNPFTRKDKLMESRRKIATKVNNLEQLKKIEVFGNAYHDMPIFEAADRLFMSTKSVPERQAILEYISNEVMGITHKVTPKEVADHQRFLEENGTFAKGQDMPKLTKEESAEWLNMKIMSKAKDCIRYPGKDQKITLDAVTNRVYEGLVEDWGYNNIILNAMRTLKVDRTYIMAVIEILFDEDGDPIQPASEPGGSDARQPAVAEGYSEDGRASPYYTASLMSIDEAHEAHDELEKSQVKGFIRTKKGKMERVNPFGRKGEKKGKSDKTKVGDTVQFKHQIGHMTFGTKTGKVVKMEGDRAHIESGGKTYKKTNWKKK